MEKISLKDAWQAVKTDTVKAEEAITAATHAGKDGKVMAPIVEVEGEKYYAVED